MSSATQQPPIDAGLSLAERARIIEALVFASAEPVAFKKLSPYLSEETEIAEIIDLIKSRYDERSGIEFKVIDQTLAFRTRADIAAHLSLERPVQKPLSRAALEVLAIIAYHQPITRSEIEEIRGISLSRGTIDILLELEWIRPRGRRRTPGRPLTWGTSTAFLDHFGLSSVSELPGMEDLKSAGLLRKGAVIGGLGETSMTAEDDADNLSEEELEDEVLAHDVDFFDEEEA
jgi:segregation and condensation protein B